MNLRPILTASLLIAIAALPAVSALGMVTPVGSSPDVYMPPPSHCTLTYCPPSSGGVCYQSNCPLAPAILMMTCSSICSLPMDTFCAVLPTTCAGVQTILSTPVGSCTFGYCDDADACVRIDLSYCVSIPSIPAPGGCVGVHCNEGDLVCVWTPTTPSGVCDSDFVTCGPITCSLIPATGVGACAGSPRAAGDTTAPHCYGNIACYTIPDNRYISNTDYCVLIYTYA